METFYKLNKNFDLPEENFIIKKGTFVSITDIYNENDASIPTVLSVNFKGINGSYNIKQEYFNQLKLDGHLKALVPKFNKGDCVTYSTEKGIVMTRKPDQWNNFMYGVKFSSTSLLLPEDLLKSCE
ncbi:hypothetical protein ACX0HA_01495 [Flavobacterium hauense]